MYFNHFLGDEVASIVVIYVEIVLEGKYSRYLSMSDAAKISSAGSLNG